MRAAPAVQVSVTRFGVWRAAVRCVAAIALLTTGAWLASHGLARGWAAALPASIAAAAACLATLWLAHALARTRPFDLGWDGQTWQLRCEPSTPANDPVPGELRVAVDLGGWLLLRFQPERSIVRGAAPPRWLPIQRHGLESTWHALRCAVYSPRPTPEAGTAPGP